MAQKKRTKKTSQGKHGGGGKVKLTPQELFALGKGPFAAATSRMYRDSLKNPGARPAKGSK